MGHHGRSHGRGRYREYGGGHHGGYGGSHHGGLFTRLLRLLMGRRHH